MSECQENQLCHVVFFFMGFPSLSLSPSLSSHTHTRFLRCKLIYQSTWRVFKKEIHTRSVDFIWAADTKHGTEQISEKSRLECDKRLWRKLSEMLISNLDSEQSMIDRTTKGSFAKLKFLSVPFFTSVRFRSSVFHFRSYVWPFVITGPIYGLKLL